MKSDSIRRSAKRIFEAYASSLWLQGCVSADEDSRGRIAEDTTDGSFDSDERSGRLG
jgi:hypothetical protein